MKLGFLASHGGSNMQAILERCRSGSIAAEPRILISNNANAAAIEKARRFGLETRVFNGKTHPEFETLDQAIADALQTAEVDLVVLAGYMKQIGSRVLTAYRNRILNIHPSLLPKFGGKGMYGMRVHEAVIAAGETQSGATVHLIDAEYDEGPILQQRTVPVLPSDTSESLHERVLEMEHNLYSDTLARIANGEIRLPPQ